ncbi:ten-Eleven Translocation (TET) family protein isoform X2 [Haematobia irritans]|uniref:ten-Eleven Translocation (TET) family protein isoform X2 n=1 Tax=Haematobia irritans TaxID=7368 RepID=UPI003F4FD451
MASSVVAQSSGGPQETSAHSLHHQQQQHQQQQTHHQQQFHQLTTTPSPIHHNSHLQHLSSLSHHYTAAAYQTSATTAAFVPHHHSQYQHYTTLQGQQQHTTQQQHQSLYQQPHHHHPQQQQQQQQQHWDYYARQPPPGGQQQQQQQTQNQIPTSSTTTPQPLQSSTPTSTTSNNNSSGSNNNNSNNRNSNNNVTSASSDNNTNNNNNNCHNATSNTNDSSVSSQTNGSTNNNYTRPWEMESKDSNSNSNSNPIQPQQQQQHQPKSGFEPFSKLPSFSSQFYGFNELMADGTPIPPTAAAAAAASAATSAINPSLNSLQTVAMSPASISVSSPGMVSVGSPLTQLASLQTSITPPSSGFTPLGAPPPPVPANAFHPHHRSTYPLVPAALPPSAVTASGAGYTDPLLYQPLTPSYAPPTPNSLVPPSLQSSTSTSSSSTMGMHKKENSLSAFDLNTNSNGSLLSAPTSNTPNPMIATPMGMHTPTPSYDGASSSSMMDISNHGIGGSNAGYHTPHSTHTSTGSHTPHTTQPHTPTPSTTTPIKTDKVLSSPVARLDARKKERRKNRTNSLESSAESEASAMDVDPSNPGQVDAVSSTANFKSPISGLGVGDSNDGAGEKQSKKKRKRCGECIGCQRKDNCGDCAPCRNDKSHQICKQRRCEKLTEKKEPKAKQVVYGPDGQPVRPEKRGRGKSSKTASGSTTPTTGTPSRGRKPSAKSAKLNAAATATATAHSPRQIVANSTLSPVGVATAAGAVGVPHPSPNTNTPNSNNSTATAVVGNNNLLATSSQQQQQQLGNIHHQPNQQQHLQQHQQLSNNQQLQQHHTQSSSNHLHTSQQQQQQQQQSQHQLSSLHNQQQPQQHLSQQQQLSQQQHHHQLGQQNQQQQQSLLHHQQPQQQQQHHQLQQHQITAQIQTMKDQPQQPMAPMAFYPTWQADPSQGWQNQFIQQIPQNTPGITSLNSLDFQTQSYGYPSNGYVQTGLGFDPNYGRSPYGAPVQRYDFQSQQLSSGPLNQVGLQSVGFAPSSVAYAGQVSTGPSASSVSLQQQQHLGSVTDLNKTMSGNDTPGYPRVSSVPPRSLNCNGYSGEYSGSNPQQTSTSSSASAASSGNGSSITNVNGGHQTIAHNTTAASQPAASPMQTSSNQTVPQSPTRGVMQQQQQQQPASQTMTQQARHVSQSPNQVAQSPNANMSSSQSTQQQYGGTTIPASPLHGVGGIQSQGQNTGASPPQQPQPMQQDWSWNNQTQTGVPDPYQQTTGPGGERVNVNTRIKSMIMRKNDPKDPLSSSAPPDIHGMPGAPPSSLGVGGPNGNQQQQQTGHFLSYSHHLRGDSAMNSNGSNGTSGTATTHQTQTAGQTSLSTGLTSGVSLAPEPIGGGGDQIWKPHHSNSFKKPVASGFPTAEHQHIQQPLAQAPPQHTTTAHADQPKKSSRRSRSNRSSSSASANASASNASNTDNSDMDKNSNDPGGGHHLTHLTNIKMEKGVPYPPPPSSHYPPQHPDYHHSPYIKTEPGLIPGQHNKMEGYERNYQNFVQYADFCQNEVQGQPGSGGPQQPPPPHHQNQQDYPSGYHHNSSYYGSSTTFQQSYQQNFVPNYQHSASAFGNTHGMHPHTNTLSSGHTKSMNGPLSKHHGSSLHHHSSHMMDIDRKPETSSIIPLPTNYEKDIPAHAYPIPPHRYPLGHGPTTHPHLSSGGLLEPKVEDMGSGAYGPGGSGYVFHGEGGPAAIKNSTGFSCCRQGSTRAPTAEHLKDGSCLGMQTKDEILDEEEVQAANQNGAKPKKKAIKQEEPSEITVKHEKINPMFDTSDRLEKGNKTEVPECDCFQSDKSPPEPGTYYTHLGTASNLADLRREFEERCQVSGRQLRIEKILYTGKEGKTSTGCPLAKWIIRRADPEEKILVVVKKRPGHRCIAAFIVVCMVVWDGMPRLDADNAYTNLIPKLNKFGLPTTRRCATNENRTCACQGLDPETSGASYSFGCSWSMYYNGCKYARSKTVRKFRLSVKSEEAAIEEHMNMLATILAPVFKQLCPRSYDNQTRYEKEAQDCRLGNEEGKPFSGVSACLDFCAHAHRDLHNMQDGCTVQVALLKPCNRDISNPDDEQLHVLPLYTMDTTDEFESADGQRDKHRTGAVQVLDKFPCEVRVRSTPLIPCRRHGKKRKEDEPAAIEGESSNSATTPATAPSSDSNAQAVANTAAAGAKKDSSGNANTANSGNASTSKSKSKAKNQQSSNTTPSAPPTTPSPRCQTPVTNNPSPAGSAFSTPPVSNNNNNGNNGGSNHSNAAPNNGTNAAGGNTNQLMSSNSSLMNMATMIDTFTDAQLQSNQISSTVLDSPYSYDYQTGSYIDSRNYYGNWPPPPHPHNPHAAAHNVPAMGAAPPGPGPAVTAPSNTNPTTMPATPNPAGHQITTPQHTPATQLETNSYNTSCYNQLPTAGSHQLTQVHDVRGEVKSRGSEENPDSTTLVNNSLAAESKLTTLTPMAPMTNITTQHHSPAPPHPHASPLEEGFVKPKPPTDYSQYSQYPNNYQMYPPPHSAYSAYDAYQNMNYNYGYHQAYSPYGMYPQQTPPPTPPPPSPNWNVYGHHQGSSGATATPYSSAPLPPSATGPIHQSAPSMNSTSLPPGQTNISNGSSVAGGSNVKPTNDGALAPVTNTAASLCGTAPSLNTANSQNTPLTDLNQTTGTTNISDETNVPNPNSGLTSPDMSNTNSNNSNGATSLVAPVTTVASTAPSETINNTATPSPVSAPNETSNPASTTSSSNSNKIEPIGEISDFSENLEAFQDPQMGGVAIALNHGSVMIECAKHEMHSTTSLKNPNRHEPTRMTLIFYQHRNLNRHHHGIDEWEEKMRVKKINTDLDNKAKEEKEKIKKESLGENDEDDEGDEGEAPPPPAPPSNTAKGNSAKKDSSSGNQTTKTSSAPKKKKESSSKKNSQNNSNADPKNEKVALRAPTLTTTSWTTLFPMHPCVITGPYQEGNSSPTSTTVQNQQQQQQQQMNEQSQPTQQLQPQPQPQPMQT